MKIPPIGLGTWQLTGAECTKTVMLALQIGYRHIDTAHVYENHHAISKAIKGFDRKQLFITSKLSLDQVDPHDVQRSVHNACNLALKELDTEYLDLYLIHWPDRSLPLLKIFQAIEILVQEKKVRQAGVSNFTLHHIEDLLKGGSKPLFNQVEFHPYLYQKELLHFCRDQGIELVAYRPFGKGQLLNDPVLKEIGQIHRKNTAQIILRWLIEKQIPVIPKASSEKHLRENLDVFDFVLSDQEIQQIKQLHRNKRFCGEEDDEFNY